jgi:subfamily B ATP-binding cassette protein MsbA
MVDGFDLRDVAQASLRGQMGMVPQDPFLFNGTVEDNIRFGRLSAAHEDVVAAAEAVGAHHFITRLRSGYDTGVQEGGVLLSVGQRQLISFARALLADPRILILDEATSSLDSESEAAIQEGLAYLMKGRTTFVIAHRLSTIRRAEQILVVEDGRIVERGTHQSLYDFQGRYYDLYTRQHGIDANLFLAPGEGDETPEAQERKARMTGPAAPTAASLLRGGIA